MRKLALLLAVLLLAAACGGSDSEADERIAELDQQISDLQGKQGTTQVPATTTTSTTTTSTTTTTLATTTTSTTRGTTTTTLPPETELSTPELVAALPSVSELPLGWGALTEATAEDIIPRSGVGFGICGGDDLHGRMANSGISNAASVFLATDQDQTVLLLVASAPDSEAASRFMQVTAAAVTCGYLEFDVLEIGDGENFLDFDVPTTSWFVSSDSDDELLWRASESYRVGPVEAPASEEAFSVVVNSEYTTTANDVTYGLRNVHLDLYMRRGNNVIVLSVRGFCCEFGFSNTATQSDDTRPRLADVSESADRLAALVFDALSDDSRSV